MSRAAWSCAECDKNNSAQDDVCRICSASRTDAGGVVRAPVQRVRQTLEQPLFVESRYSAPPPRLIGTGPPPMFTAPPPVFTTPRPVGPRPAPPMPRPAPPMPRPPAPRPAVYRRRSRGRAWRWILLVLAGLFVLGNLDKILGLLPDLGGVPDATPPAATACPSEVAQWLPDGGSGAVLEAAYTTSKHVITLCWTAGGELYYDGLVQGMPANADTHLSIRATQTAAGYTAVNGAYRYEISGTEVIIFKNDVEQIRYVLTRTGP